MKHAHLLISTTGLWLLSLLLPACNGAKDPFAGKTVEDMDMALEMMEHRESNNPSPGKKAPDLTLTDRETGKRVKLSSFWKEKPAVLIFGSLSCDRTYESTPDVMQLHSRFKDNYQFVFVYIREAHPSNGWEYVEGYPKVVDPSSLEIRKNVASRFCRTFEPEFPTVIDDLDDKAAVRYAAWPLRLYVVDQKGIVKYQGDPGPWGFRPTEQSKVLYFKNEPDSKVDWVPDPKKSVSLESFLMR
ncbi:MAG: redoxin domain-containing protein [Verrucomicrobiales bacterium]|nr:redoxin domain-containing protein [Verrucomicrobiales bacterium]